jgi:acetyltransferase-like isoleucine patch superfamily enzyme
MKKLTKFFKNPFVVFSLLYKFCIFLKLKFQFKNVGFGTKIRKQILITNKKRISLGKRVLIMQNGRIEMITKYAGELFYPNFEIGNDSQIHQNCHITCANNIQIGDNVIIVSNVTITDIIHPYEDIHLPINQSKIKTFPVSIGNQSYIYNNSVILPGTRIGKHCVIGANSIVNSEIPDYSVAVGNPARVVKRYNFETNTWDKV